MRLASLFLPGIIVLSSCGSSAPATRPSRARASKPVESPPRARAIEPSAPKDGGDEDNGDLGAIEARVRPEESGPASCDGRTPAPSHARRRERLIWPVDGVVISAFGARDGSPHEGIDIAAPIGTPIWASRDGDVLYSGEQPGYGLIVILRHTDELVTIYAHNAKNCVTSGSRVTQGEVIAVVGESGGASSPSVHFEVRIGNKTVNPRAHLAD